MDEQGTKIQANVLQKRVPKFSNLLQEGAAVFIKNLKVARHATKYKLIDNKNKLNLYYKSSVSDCRDFKGSIFGLSIVKFANLICKSILEHTAVDIIGEVIACETMVTLPDNNLESEEKLYDRRLGKEVDGKRLFECWSDADQEGKGSAIKTLKIPKVEKLMDVNNITFLEDLDIQKDDFTVKVQIVRLWKQPVFKNPDEIYSIEMILMDEQEGAAVFIKNPTIARLATKYKLIDNTNKLSLYYKTSVSNSQDFKGSIFGFSFVKFTNLISKSIPELAAVDVIGEVIACETMVTLPNNNGKAKRRMQVEMQDLEQVGIKMQVTLWDAFAHELNDYVSTNKDKGIVILVIQFAMVKIYRERPFLSNSFNGTRLFINSHIDEIKEFKKRFLDRTSRANIVEISETVEAKSLIVLGTVKAFRKDVPWFYMGCMRCNRKVRPMYTITDKDD
ncbi:uncharacterized protein LOC112510808 [Cynara cardunculus var. scolymus]|uniref:uncharacterized protein LOC112510808 n=1 Tax=Cynara cardunculus var. scolymus TaxID=59895 RepID=UPI000D626511|nr:uncharacterized protein LOC112510808 [Cynara cardunculus var. scolymus]